MKFNLTVRVKRSFFSFLSGFTTFFLTFQIAFGGMSLSAIAAPSQSHSLAASPTDIATTAQQKVQENVDAVKDTAKDKLDSVVEKLEDNGYQARDEAKQEAHEAQAKLENDKELINNRTRIAPHSTGNAANRDQNRMGQAADRVGEEFKEAFENTADSMRKMVGK